MAAPTLTFEAGGTRDALQICNESWLLDDLALLRSGGEPICTAQSKFSVRLATDEEAAAFEKVAERQNHPTT
jgi:hypothetical protein